MATEGPKASLSLQDRPKGSLVAETGHALELSAGDRVLVTGASGFIGSAVTRALLDRSIHVVALLQPGADHANLDGLEVERVPGDLRDRLVVNKVAENCRAVMHVAALYRFWAPDPEEFYQVNVLGTLNVLAAARDAGCERVVYTSTVGTIGLDKEGRPVDEGSFAHVDHLFGWYKKSKYVAEHEVLRAAAEGLPVTLVQPTLPLGPGDRAPTPTGKIVLDFLNGRMPAYVDTALNVVDVDDVAQGHLLALERGRQGRSYILGGENVEFRQILQILASFTGLPAPRYRVPRSVALSAAYLSYGVEGKLLQREPSVPLEGTLMSTTRMVFDDTRARSELGYTSRPASQSIQRSAQWFIDHGYVRKERLARIAPARPDAI